jgi:predicted transcriptional regulator
MANDALSLKYFFRIVAILAEQQHIGKSRLVSLTGINHQRCSEILDWMEMHGLVSLEGTAQNNRRQVVVTEKGLKYFVKLSSIPLPPFSKQDNQPILDSRHASF